MLVAESLQSWTGAERPLRGLTKVQLFKYPLADPTPSAEWDFSKEIMIRMHAFTSLLSKEEAKQREVERLTWAIRTAETNLSNAQQEQTHPDLLTVLKRTVENAKLSLERSKKEQATLAAKVKTAGQADDVVTIEEARAHYVTRYLGEWNRLVREFKEENLFQAQTWGFTAFLMATKGQQSDDAKKYKYAEGISILAGQDRSIEAIRMKCLYHLRVMPSIQERREFVPEHNGGDNVASLKPERRKRYWAWWREYNLATLRYDWADDSGVARDERQFNPEQAGAAEQVND